MERIRVSELLKQKTASVGRNVTRMEAAMAIHHKKDAISVKYLAHLLTRWDKGERIGSFSPRYAIRLCKYFEVRDPKELFEA